MHRAIVSLNSSSRKRYSNIILRSYWSARDLGAKIRWKKWNRRNNSASFAIAPGWHHSRRTTEPDENKEKCLLRESSLFRRNDVPRTFCAATVQPRWPIRWDRSGFLKRYWRILCLITRERDAGLITDSTSPEDTAQKTFQWVLTVGLRVRASGSRPRHPASPSRSLQPWTVSLDANKSPRTVIRINYDSGRITSHCQRGLLCTRYEFLIFRVQNLNGRSCSVVDCSSRFSSLELAPSPIYNSSARDQSKSSSNLDDRFRVPIGTTIFTVVFTIGMKDLVLEFRLKRIIYDDAAKSGKKKPSRWCLSWNERFNVDLDLNWNSAMTAFNRIFKIIICVSFGYWAPIKTARLADRGRFVLGRKNCFVFHGPVFFGRRKDNRSRKGGRSVNDANIDSVSARTCAEISPRRRTIRFLWKEFTNT